MTNQSALYQCMNGYLNKLQLDRRVGLFPARLFYCLKLQLDRRVFNRRVFLFVDIPLTDNYILTCHNIGERKP